MNFTMDLSADDLTDGCHARLAEDAIKVLKQAIMRDEYYKERFIDFPAKKIVKEYLSEIVAVLDEKDLSTFVRLKDKNLIDILAPYNIEGLKFYIENFENPSKQELSLLYIASIRYLMEHIFEGSFLNFSACELVGLLDVVLIMYGDYEDVDLEGDSSVSA